MKKIFFLIIVAVGISMATIYYWQIKEQANNNFKDKIIVSNDIITGTGPKERPTILFQENENSDVVEKRTELPNFGEKIIPSKGTLIEDSFFYDVGFLDASKYRGINGFIPISENGESTLEEYGFVQGDIITEIEGEPVKTDLGDFLNELETLRANPKTFFDEVIVFTINRNNELLELEVAID